MPCHILESFPCFLFSMGPVKTMGFGIIFCSQSCVFKVVVKVIFYCFYKTKGVWQVVFKGTFGMRI